jgi:hypothetical protein
VACMIPTTHSVYFFETHQHRHVVFSVRLELNICTPCDRSEQWTRMISVAAWDTAFFLFGATAPQGARASTFTRFLDHTQRRTTVSRTPLDE